MLARKLLTSHSEPAMEEDTVKRAVDVLTRELGSHDYIISRQEAKGDLKLPVTFPSDEFEASMWSLFKEYQGAMKLAVPYNPETELAGQDAATVTFRRAFIESASLTHVFETIRAIRRITATQQGVEIPGVQEVVLKEGWTEYR